MLMNGETGGENSEIKIETGEAGEAKRNTQQVEPFHALTTNAFPNTVEISIG